MTRQSHEWCTVKSESGEESSRRVPYRSVLKNNTWPHHRAAALNLRRLVNLGLTRTSDGNWALA